MTSIKRVLITDAVHPLLIEGFQDRGYLVDYFPAILQLEVELIIHQYTGLIVNSKVMVSRDLMQKGKQLQFVARLGSGLEVIDQEAAEQLGIKAYNSPEGNCNAVAEHALGMLLMLQNQLKMADEQVRQFIWEREARRGTELTGKTIGIIGYGHTGQAFAKVLSGFEMNIIAYDKYHSQPVFPHVKMVEHMQDIQSAADILSLHLPLTDETHGLVDAHWLQQCQTGAILINTSRGSMVNSKDLLQALATGKIGGACLDVFENEKPESYHDDEKKVYQAIFALPQVVVSPHIAGWTKESKIKIAQVVLEKHDKLIN
jgi:D-3-phosphoglycerate dehydrogenase